MNGRTCVIGDVAFEVEWVSIVHWICLPPRRLCRATAMLSLFNAINIHDVTTDTRIRVSWGWVEAVEVKEDVSLFWLGVNLFIALQFLVNNLNFLSVSIYWFLQDHIIKTSRISIYSNLFQACFSYSTILCLRFLGLQKVRLQAVNDAENKIKTHRTRARGSIKALCCRLWNLSLKRLPSGFL